MLGAISLSLSRSLGRPAPMVIVAQGHEGRVGPGQVTRVWWRSGHLVSGAAVKIREVSKAEKVITRLS